MRVWLVLSLVVLAAGCAPSAIVPGPTPRPTFTAIEVYLNETDPISESLATGARVMKEQLSAEEADPRLLTDPSWRDTMTKDLRQLREDYQTLTQAWAPPGSEQYHQALTAAEAHTDKAAQLLLAWLDDRDAAKLTQAMQEMKLEETQLAQAQQLLDSLLKK
jgi:hypothetical protein